MVTVLSGKKIFRKGWLRYGRQFFCQLFYNLVHLIYFYPYGNVDAEPDYGKYDDKDQCEVPDAF